MKPEEAKAHRSRVEKNYRMGTISQAEYDREIAILEKRSIPGPITAGRLKDLLTHVADDAIVYIETSLNTYEEPRDGETRFDRGAFILQLWSVKAKS